VTRVQTALQFLQGLPPEVLAYVKWDELLYKVFYGLSLPDSVKTQQEVQEEQQQQQMMQAQNQAMAAGGQELATGAAQAMMSQAQAQPPTQ